MKETDTKTPISADASREQSSDNAMAYDSGLGAVRAPADWSRPMLDFVFLPAHAQASAPGRGSFGLSANSRTSSVEVVVPGDGEVGEQLVLLLSEHMNPTQADIAAAAMANEALGVMFVEQAGQTLENSGFGAGTRLVIDQPVAGDMYQVRVVLTDPLPDGLAGTSSRLWASFHYIDSADGAIRSADGAQPVPVDINYPELVMRGRVSIDGEAVTSAEVPQTVSYAVPPGTPDGDITYSLPPNSPLVFVDASGNPLIDSATFNSINEVTQSYTQPGPNDPPVVQTFRVQLRSGLSPEDAPPNGEVPLTVRDSNGDEISEPEDVIPVVIPAPASGDDVLTIGPVGFRSRASGDLVLGSRRARGSITLRIVGANGVIGFVDDGNLDGRGDLRQTLPNQAEFLDSRPRGGFSAGDRISFSIDFLLGSSSGDLLAGVQSEYTVQAFYTPVDGEEIEIATEFVRVVGNTETLPAMEQEYIRQLLAREEAPAGAIVIKLPNGPPGDPGMPGPIGPAGSGGAGLDGRAGDRGATGPIGPRGPRGPRGTTGATGSQGIQEGATGVTGSTGEAGVRGPQGPTAIMDAADPGVTGATGATGEAGETGPAGAVLSVMEARSIGFIGPTGVLGEIGATGGTGVTGEPGIPGPVGPDGQPGERGGLGFSGLSGRAGSTGPIGPRGAPGDEGQSGDRGSLTVGARGLVGPTGATGLRGQDGASGDTGMTAATGATGLRGQDGARGSTGPRLIGRRGGGGTGIRGPAGPAGGRGAIGLRGATGPIGQPGPVGPGA